MKKPLALSIISVILIILGILRVYSGADVLSNRWDYLAQTNQLTYIIIENFIVGLFVILSGLFLFYGRSAGRLILLLGIVVSLTGTFINYGKISKVALLSLTAILLFVIPGIQQYFSRKKN